MKTRKELQEEIDYLHQKIYYCKVNDLLYDMQKYEYELELLEEELLNNKNKVRIWLEDSIEEQGGIWCYGYINNDNMFCPDINDNIEDRDTIEQYIKWGYKVEYI